MNMNTYSLIPQGVLAHFPLCKFLDLCDTAYWIYSTPENHSMVSPYACFCTVTWISLCLTQPCIAGSLGSQSTAAAEQALGQVSGFECVAKI